MSKEVIGITEKTRSGKRHYLITIFSGKEGVSLSEAANLIGRIDPKEYTDSKKDVTANTKGKVMIGKMGKTKFYQEFKR